MKPLVGPLVAAALLASMTACGFGGERPGEDGPGRSSTTASSTSQSPRASARTSDGASQTMPPHSDAPLASSVVLQLTKCEHSTGAYRIDLPEGWWTNGAFDDDELGSISACRFFAPDEFDVTTGDREAPVPDGAAISMDFLDGGCVGYINPVLESRATTVDGYAAVVSELAEGKLATNPASTYEYVVSLTPDLACEAGGRYIYAFTKRTFPGDYNENKLALDQMMQSLEVLEFGAKSGGISPEEEAIIDALLRFARTGDPSAAAAIPFADEGVALGLSNELLGTRSAEELSDAGGWTLEAEVFRGYVGPFSSVKLLRDAGEVTFAAGPHPHCASPPVQPHPDTAGMRQLSIQPVRAQSCVQWWTVDVFLDGGDVAAVTMDLWVP